MDSPENGDVAKLTWGFITHQKWGFILSRNGASMNRNGLETKWIFMEVSTNSQQQRDLTFKHPIVGDRINENEDLNQAKFTSTYSTRNNQGCTCTLVHHTPVKQTWKQLPIKVGGSNIY